MDNTDIKQKRVLYQRFHNPETGETVLKTKPKVSREAKVIYAIGTGRHTVGAVLISRLRPFRSAMIEGLRRKGVNISALNFRSIVAEYYHNFVKPFDRSAFINNVSFKLEPTDEPSGDVTESRNAMQFVEVKEVVDSIIRVFRDAKAKYEISLLRGDDPFKSLTDEELLQAKATMQVQKKLLSSAMADNYMKAEGSTFLYWILGVVLILYLLQ